MRCAAQTIAMPSHTQRTDAASHWLGSSCLLREAQQPELRVGIHEFRPMPLSLSVFYAIP
jgi:hypothetical protein